MGALKTDWDAYYEAPEGTEWERLPDFTALAPVKQGYVGITIIAVTSYALSGDDAKAFEAGCDDYVAKPFSPRALLAKIRKFLP